MDPSSMAQIITMLRSRMGGGQPTPGANPAAQNARFGASMTPQEQQASGPHQMAGDPYTSQRMLQKYRERLGMGQPQAQSQPNAFRQFQSGVQDKMGAMVQGLRNKMLKGLDAYRLHSQEAQAGISDTQTYNDWVKERQ
mgnify:CR=1 FL=1